MKQSIATNTHQAYDLIADTHGQLAKLTSLLTQLGYQPTADDSWKHPTGRKVVFLGDYVDRGPDVRGVLLTVRAMCNAGDALAIMGNHEFNLLCYHTRNTDSGDWLRPHTERNALQNKATRDAFAEADEEFQDHLNWIKTLPVTLDLPGFRCVHACWDDRYVHLLPAGCFADPGFLQQAATEGTQIKQAVDTLLKGPEIKLPEGCSFTNHEGHQFSTVRVKWWGNTATTMLGGPPLPFATLEALRLPLANDALRLASYPKTAKTVFFGHYWLPPDAPKVPLAENVCCLDFSAGRRGPLTAYRWDGETVLSETKITVGRIRDIREKLTDAFIFR